MNMWCPVSRECVYAGVAKLRPYQLQMCGSGEETAAGLRNGTGEECMQALPSCTRVICNRDNTRAESDAV